MILVCELCGAKLGTFKPEELTLPLSGKMFGPLGPGFAAPFDAAAPWEFLLCPICHNRAMGWDFDSTDMVRPDRLMTTDGYLIVGHGLETPPPAPYVHDSAAIAREWDAAVAAREAARQEPTAAQEQPAPSVPDPVPAKRKSRR